MRVGRLSSDATGTERLAPFGNGVRRLVVTNALLWVLEAALRQKDAQLDHKEAQLRRQDATMRELPEQLGDLEAQRRQQDVLIAAQGERRSELERRLGRTSANSSKPPASDGLHKPPAVPKRGDGPQQSRGGQKDHDGTT